MGRRWIGQWIIAVALLHTVFGIVAFAPVIRTLFGNGLWNSVGGSAMHGAVAWFLLAGGFMLVAGLAIDSCERSKEAISLRASGWGMAIVTAIAIVLMPVSGAWLLLPPTIAMFFRKAKI